MDASAMLIRRRLEAASTARTLERPPRAVRREVRVGVGMGGAAAAAADAVGAVAACAVGAAGAAVAGGAVGPLAVDAGAACVLAAGA
jgi:hypothetical protein